MQRENIKFLALAIFVTVFCSLVTYSTWVRENSVITYFGTGPESIRVYGDKNLCQIISIEGDSMYPSMTSANTIIAENISFFGIDNVVVGDVVVFLRDQKYVCHRVVEVHEDHFNVRGDNNPINDPSVVPFSEVKWVVVAVLR
jgi:signal peptidase I